MDTEERRALGRQGIDEAPPGIRDAGREIRALLQERSGYGGLDNLRCAGDLEEAYQHWADRANRVRTPYPTAHDHCIRMILTKISRIATGDANEDNYRDIQGYAELARKLIFDDEPTG